MDDCAQGKTQGTKVFSKSKNKKKRKQQANAESEACNSPGGKAGNRKNSAEPKDSPNVGDRQGLPMPSDMGRKVGSGRFSGSEHKDSPNVRYRQGLPMLSDTGRRVGSGRFGQPANQNAESQLASQYVVTASDGGRSRNVSHVQDLDHSRQHHRRGNEDRNASNNANADRHWNKGRTRAEGKGQGQNGKSDARKGRFASLEGGELLRELATHRIFELRKRNPSFPNARYFCRLCEYHLDRPQDCDRHVDENRHSRKKEASDLEGILEHVPEPTPAQIKALDSVVESVVLRSGVLSNHFEIIHDVVNRLENFICKFKEDVKLQLYGSMLTRSGTGDSCIDVDVTGSGPTPALLISVYNILQQSGAPDFVDVESDYNAKFPVVRMMDSQTGRVVVLAINSQPAVLTSKLLELYFLADPRARKLAVTLRHWADLCHLDRQEEGTLPAFALNIMVVYFLQQIQPPVLNLLPLPKAQTEKGSTPMKMEDKVDFDSLRKQAELWKSENKSSVGQLWLQMLKFYCLDFDNTNYVISILETKLLKRQEKKWLSKKLAIEDPFSTKKNVATSMANSLIFEYFQSCLRKAYEYFAMPRDHDGNLSISLEALKVLAKQKTDSLLRENHEPSSSSSSVSQSDRESPQKTVTVETKEAEGNGKEEEENGEVAASEMSDSNDEPVVVPPNTSILQKLKEAVVSDKGQGSKGEEPHTVSSSSDITLDSVPPTSVSELDITSDSVSMVSSSECYVTASEMDITVDSFIDASGMSAASALPPSDVEETGKTHGVSATSALPPSDVEETEKTHGLSAASALPSSDIEETGKTHSSDEEEDEEEDYETSPESPPSRLSDDEEIKENVSQEESDGKVSAGQPVAETLPDAFEELTVEVEEEKTEASDSQQETEVDDSCELEEGSFEYIFTADVFTSGKGPAVICGYCEQEGHIKANCPDDKLPGILPLPPITRDHINLLNSVISKIIYHFSPTERHVMQRNQVVRDLESFVQQIYPDARFSLFGSSCNGFGFHSSDLDICMTFKGKTVEDIDVVEVIETVAAKLMQRGKLYNVISIPTAKVPIVKFTDRETRLDGDISLYNTLAQRNTKLLWFYSEIDQRVKILGYAVKVFAKVCDIGDASRGSLSSYAYILMMIHYLQQCNPPVIPVLQELRPIGEWPEVVVEGCNTWFFDDHRQLRHVWRERPNSQGVGELWLGFLRYYLEDFDWKSMVVTIRQKARLTKFEKMWTGKSITVEDPFDLTHNLGGGLSRKMNNYIYKTFVNGRTHFGTPLEYNQSLFSRYPYPQDYFFNMELLTDGKPPNDRGCRLCGKIGHMVKNCPNRTGNKRRQQAQREGEGKKGGGGAPDKQQEKKESRREDKESRASGSKPQEGGGGGGKGKKGKGQEKPDGHPKTAAARMDQKGIDQDSPQDKSLHSPPASAQQESRSHEDKSFSAKRNAQSALAGRAILGTKLVSPTTSSAITTTATNTSGMTTLTSSSGSFPNLPPGFTPIASKPQSNLDTSSQRVGAVFSMPSDLASSPPTLTSTPISASKSSVHPPGFQIDIQHLFNMAQQSGSPASLSSLPPHSQPGASPGQFTPSPDYQNVRPGLQSPRQTPGASLQAGSRPMPPKMTPLPLTSLFQSQSPASQQQVFDAKSTHQAKPSPLKSSLQSQLSSESASRASPEGAGKSAPQPIPVPLQTLFHASSPPTHHQGLSPQEQFLQTLMMPGPRQAEVHKQLRMQQGAEQSQAVRLQSPQGQPMDFHTLQNRLMGMQPRHSQPMGGMQTSQGQPMGIQTSQGQPMGMQQASQGMQPMKMQSPQGQSMGLQYLPSGHPIMAQTSQNQAMGLPVMPSRPMPAATANLQKPVSQDEARMRGQMSEGVTGLGQSAASQQPSQGSHPPQQQSQPTELQSQSQQQIRPVDLNQPSPLIQSLHHQEKQMRHMAYLQHKQWLQRMAAAGLGAPGSGVGSAQAPPPGLFASPGQQAFQMASIPQIRNPTPDGKNSTSDSSTHDSSDVNP